MNCSNSMDLKLGPKILMSAVATATGVGLLIFLVTRITTEKAVLCDPSLGSFKSCYCPPGHIKSSSGYCTQGIGGQCEKPTDCHDNLVCYSGKCACRLPDQEYLKERNACISKIDGPCIDLQNCPKHSFCQKFSFQYHGRCKCNSGFIESGNGRCEARYLQTCSSSIPCDSISELLCINGLCRCQNFGYYDESKRICLGLVGSTCNPVSQEAPCVENAECVRKHPKLLPSCICKDRFSVDAAYTCQEWSK